MNEQNKVNTIKVSCAVFRNSRILAKELTRLLELSKIEYRDSVKPDCTTVEYEDKCFKFVPLAKVSEV